MKLPLLSVLTLVVSSAVAQATPATLSKASILLQASAGTAPWSSNGYALLIPSKSAYNIIGVGGLENSQGTYVYEPALTPAVLKLTDSGMGPVDYQLFFDTTNAGIYSSSSEVFGGKQLGMFDLYNGTALTALKGQTLELVVSTGFELPTNGISLITLGAKNMSYTTIGEAGATNSSGTYTYAVSNSVVGEFRQNDVVFGNYTTYLAFHNTYSGVYVSQVPANSTQTAYQGGYQVGAFMFLTATPPTLTISNLKSKQALSSRIFTVTGKATDKIAVTKVYYSLNAANWQLATGTTSWSVPLLLSFGTNSFAAYAVDNSGNISTVHSVTFTAP